MSCRAAVAVTVQTSAARWAAHSAPEPEKFLRPITGVRSARSAVLLSSGSCGRSWCRASPSHSLLSVAMTLAAAGCSKPFPASLACKDAVRVDVGEGPLPAALGALVCLGARCGGRQRVVRPVQHRDPLGPRIAPVAERLGVSGPGPQEIPPDMGKAPQRVHPVDAGQRLVGLVEVRGDDQAVAGLQL